MSWVMEAIEAAAMRRAVRQLSEADTMTMVVGVRLDKLLYLKHWYEKTTNERLELTSIDELKATLGKLDAQLQPTSK